MKKFNRFEKKFTEKRKRKEIEKERKLNQNPSREKPDQKKWLGSFPKPAI